MMSAAAEKEPCPFCGKPISVNAERCRFCGEDLYEDEERDRRRPLLPGLDRLLSAARRLAFCHPRGHLRHCCFQKEEQEEFERLRSRAALPTIIHMAGLFTRNPAQRALARRVCKNRQFANK